MKKSVTVNVESEKLSALEMYLGQKNLKLTEELDKCIETLYQKNVPQNVRNFIEMKSEKKPAKKSRNSLPAETEKLSEQ